MRLRLVGVQETEERDRDSFLHPKKLVCQGSNRIPLLASFNDEACPSEMPLQSNDHSALFPVDSFDGTLRRSCYHKLEDVFERQSKITGEWLLLFWRLFRILAKGETCFPYKSGPAIF